MAVLSQKSVLDMIKEFRRNWHTLCYSERTTVCGADAMLSVLQLSMAENNKRSQLLDFLSGRQNVVNDATDPYILRSPMSKHTQDNEKVQLLAKKIICSYLSLLVNSKNDLALAHILNIPDRGLGREAFTDLKHAAREKHLSIFLVATSFIRALELGGKGYAPSPSDPLRTHVKGLSNFINFIDKLDEILGEIPNPSIAGSRILSVIKMQLIKGQNSRDPFYKAVEEVAQDLDLRIKAIINSQQGNVTVNTTDISPARMRQTLIRSQFACTYKDDYMINKNKRNNVDPASEPLSVLHMKNDLSESVSSSVGRPTFGSSSGNVHLDRSKNEKARKPSSQTGNKSSKRKQVDLDDENILCDNGNEPPQHKNVKLPKISNNLQNKVDGKLTKVAKINKSTSKNKLLTGQTKLTQFFRL
ncbi:PCNA-interacting partner isoform X13 [Sorex fumeus]|uniref:PCNA-interacting partner isoform X13 n=1 Tax=Sorex fumeus TaxID=62283 RepID=UPI0024ACFEC8|nr:PCNA-interacting partner isoform X13 [Sorex fumeus]